MLICGVSEVRVCVVVVVVVFFLSSFRVFFYLYFSLFCCFTCAYNTGGWSFSFSLKGVDGVGFVQRSCKPSVWPIGRAGGKNCRSRSK